MYFWCNNPKEAAKECRLSVSSWCDDQIALADMALDHTFVFTDRYEMERCTTPVHFDGPIEWGKVPFDDVEWVFAFNRHTFLRHLAHAWLLTGEERYRAGWIELLTDWISRVKLDAVTSKGPWRSLESGIRIENWLRSVELFEHAGAPIPEDVRILLEDCLLVHKEYLLATHDAFHRLSNWGVLQDHGLFLAGAYFNDFETMRIAVERLDEELSFQVFPDGTHWEQSPMYQAEVLHCAMDTVLVASRIGYRLPERLLDNVHRMVLGLGKLSRPDGRLFLQGDSDDIDVTDQFMEAAVLFNDPLLSWFGRGHRDGDFLWNFPVSQPVPVPAAPSEIFFAMPCGGNYLMRTGLSEDAGCVRFHCGNYGSGHGHFDQLHVDLMVNSQPILTDCGRYTYVDTPERRALKGGAGHNTILVDGKDMSEMLDSWGVSGIAEPLPGRHHSSNEMDYVEASHLGYQQEGVLLRRKVLRIEGNLLVLCDEYYASGEHGYETLFHFDDDGSVLRSASGDIVFSSPEAHATLSFIGAGRVSLDEYPLSKRYNEMLRGARAVVENRVDGRGRMVTVVGYGKAPVDLKVSTLPVVKPLTGTEMSSDTATGIRISIDGAGYTVMFIHQEIGVNGFLMRTGEAEGYGRCLVKKDGMPTVPMMW